jgi:hypothetical protein
MKTRWPLSLCLLIGCAAAAVTPPPAELPTFKPGLWSFSLTVDRDGEKQPQVRTMTRCADPGDEIRRKWQSLAMQACKFSPVTHSGNTWNYNSACTTQGQTLQMKSVIVVNKDDSYRSETLSRSATRSSREIVVARRVGDCPAPGAGAPRVKE